MANAEEPPHPEMLEHHLREGQEAYLRYLGALASLNAPGRSAARGLIGEGRHTSLEIIVHAEGIIWDSVCRVIRHAAELPNNQGMARLENDESYRVVLPKMRYIVDSTYDDPERRKRADRMNKAFADHRPAAFCRQSIYNRICHGAPGSLNSMDMLDDIQPAGRLVPLLKARRMTITDDIQWFVRPSGALKF